MSYALHTQILYGTPHPQDTSFSKYYNKYQVSAKLLMFLWLIVSSNPEEFQSMLLKKSVKLHFTAFQRVNIFWIALIISSPEYIYHTTEYEKYICLYLSIYYPTEKFVQVFQMRSSMSTCTFHEFTLNHLIPSFNLSFTIEIFLCLIRCSLF